MSDKACSTPGCSGTAYGGSELCGKCLDGKLPLDRGPVTNAELMRARLLGRLDHGVTKQRLVKHDQPIRPIAAAIPSIVQERLLAGATPTLPTPRQLEVFVSYASEQRPQVLEIYHYLRGLGHHVWMDVFELTGAEELERTIFSALESRAYFLACLSEPCKDSSRFVFRELSHALQRAGSSRYVYLLPIVLDGSEPAPEFLDYCPMHISAPRSMEALALTLQLGSEDFL